MAMRSTDETGLLDKNVRRFAERVVAPALEEMNHYPDSPLPGALIEGMRELGLLELAVPGEDGKDVADPEALSTVVQALATTAAAPAALVLAQAIAQRLVNASGSAEGRAAVRTGAGGAVPLLAFPLYTEASEVGAAVRCRSDGDGVHVDGELEFVVNAPVADAVLVPALAEDGGGELGLILLDVHTPGLRIHEPLRTLGMRGGPVADVAFDRVRVEPWRLLTRDDGRRLVRREHDRLRDAVAALCAGVVASSAEAAIAYARERYQGGCFIIEHPEVRRMISELIADRDQCLDAVEQLGSGWTPEPRATHLFLHAKEAAARATCDGVQLLGGYGYMEDYGQERRMRDGQQARALLGRPDVLRQEVITEHLRGAA